MRRRRMKAHPRIRIPGAVVAIFCVLPVVLTILFYILRSKPYVMDWVSVSVSSPIRGFLGMLSSIYPFSLMEVLCTAAVFWLIYYIIKTVLVASHRQGKLNILAQRTLTVLVIALYIWSLNCWLWSSGYFAAGFAETYDLASSGVSVADLTAASKLFADKANEYALLVKRDGDNRFAEDRRSYLPSSVDIYSNISSRYPRLSGKLYQPKPMLFSWLMSRTGYTGIYFALTGESNINIRAPGFLLPVTIAHELAHQSGVFAEDEANFVAIVASVSSEHNVYVYSGYLSGLMHLQNALYSVDQKAWEEINSHLCQEVLIDWTENHNYWQSQKIVDTGVDILDRILTRVMQKVSDSVDTVYDGYLKSNNQVLGIRSYGACVDLLVEYFVVKHLH